MHIDTHLTNSLSEHFCQSKTKTRKWNFCPWHLFIMLSKRGRPTGKTITPWSVNRLQTVFNSCTSLLCVSLLNCYAVHTIAINSLISDVAKGTLVSSGEKFELGFFTPNGSADSRRRYVGIWYFGSNPPTIVWVANRDNPLLDSHGAFGVAEDGNLKVLDQTGRPYWSTNLEKSPAMYRSAKLTDNGNLVLSEEDQDNHSARILWQSFDNPTDTFLPGMKMDENIALTSWKSENDPATGNFTFQLDQELNQFVIWKRSIRYWKSGASGEMPSAISYFLSNFTSTMAQNSSVPLITSSLYRDSRLMMSFSGQLEYLKRDAEKVWSLVWAEPRDRCSVYNACGNFGSCNNNNGFFCKCLPGFEPSSPENWKTGDFSGGCTRKSILCSENFGSETFLSLSMMKVGNPDSQFNAKSETECKLECLNNCQCQAYSYEETKITRQSSNGGPSCWIWSDDLNNLQEEYEGGNDLYVRVAVYDIESTTRNCETCGTNQIPYPLSTGPKCGDAMYSNFQCNTSSGQVNFKAPGGSYRVTSISAGTRKFYIQTKDSETCGVGNTEDTVLQLNGSSPFHVTNWCHNEPGTLSSNVSYIGREEVEIEWASPPEPTCSSATDCRDWQNSMCNTTGDGKKRCLCDTNFLWNGLIINCTREGVYGPSSRKMPLSWIITVAFTSVILLIVLSTAIVYICLKRSKAVKERENRGNIRQALHLYDSERQVKDLIDSGRFKEEEAKGVDVPFFDFGSILAATNNFSNSNKLGQGGFGSVYKGKFPGGQEIAVKRLSSFSGQGIEEFKNEVVLIAKLQHRNLVRLLGYCIQGDEKILLYEYMPNKSLDSFIFDRKLCMLLDWDIRYNIILGIARALLYLHQDSRLRIIHRDLKTSNILLDEEMNPKISDFGLARIFGGKETAVNTKRVVGTYGYMSPEYALDGLFSFKSDVFSFGVVVLEIISGKRNTGFYQPEKSLSLLGYAWQLWKEERAVDLLDRALSESRNANEYLKCVNVGLLCVQEDPSDRPNMSNVVFMLGSETATLPTPKQPAFVVRRCPSSRASSFSKPETFSNNELTVTLEDGR